MNLILATDSYKVSHWKQYPPGTQKVFSYFEARGGIYPKTLFFGLQYILKQLLYIPVLDSDIEEAGEVFKEHFGTDSLFNREGWKIIRKDHRGFLPLKISAVPEGSLIPVSNVLMTVENTDERLPWLTNYVETVLSQVWYPMTVATLSHSVKRSIKRHLGETSDTLDKLPFMLHDFGFRGSTSMESSGIGGSAHLTSFAGTDTLTAIMLLKKYYGAKMAGYSIPAAEHSTITSWGKDHETRACLNMLGAYPTGLVAVVSDSYNIYEACEKIWGEILKDAVLKRDGVLIIRPDSGYPPDVMEKCLSILGERFGTETNSKGFKLLNPKVRMIWGDGLSPDMIDTIMVRMRMKGWSIENTAFGMGGGLLQRVERDTSRCAFKCSAIKVDGKWRDVSKSPVTDLGKASKGGRLNLFQCNETEEFITLSMDKPYPDIPDEWSFKSVLQPVYENGRFLNETTLDEIRKRVENG